MRISLPIDEQQLSTVLENICQQGCVHVDSVIEGLQKGSVPDAAASLNEDEISKLLLELLEVMQPLQHE